MNKLELTDDELKSIVANNKILGKGSYGIVYKLNDCMLFKFKYKDFIDSFDVKDGIINTRRLLHIEKKIETLKKIEHDMKSVLGESVDSDREVKKLIALKDKLRLTKLTQGLVYVNGYCVGYLLTNHKNMVNLFEFLENNTIEISDKETIMRNIENAVKELCDNNIFMRDLTTRNILVNPKTNEIQVIDFEDVCTSVREDRPLYLVKEMAHQLKEIKNYMFEKHQANEL